MIILTKEQVAHDLALLIVEARIREFQSEGKELGLYNYSDQALEDYQNAYKRIIEKLD